MLNANGIQRAFRLTIPKVWMGCLAAVVLLVGCQGEGDSSKKTLFDDEHELAAHWPEGLADLRLKLQTRLEQLVAQPERSEDSQLYAELVDLVAWTPEIAADTDLTESQWLPIRNAAEAIRKSVQGAGWTDSTKDQVAELCKLLEQAEQQLAGLKQSPEAAVEPEVTS